MNGVWKRRLGPTVAIIGLLTMALMFGIQETQAQGEITYLSLPSESTPLGLMSQSPTLWAALSWHGAIAKINVTTGEYEVFYVIGSENHEVGCYGLAIDGNGDVWITERIAGKVAKFTTSTSLFTELPVLGCEPAGIIYHEGYIWVCNRPYLTKINPDTMAMKNFDFGVNSSPWMLLGDGDYIWVSEILHGRVRRFNISTETIDLTFTGLDRPLGLAVYGDFLYVAENKQRGDIDPEIEVNGTIARIKVTDGSITRIVTAPITNEGPYMIYFDSDFNLWWTDNSFHIGVIGAISQVYNAKPYCYFMTQIDTKIYFSAVGSAHIGIVDIPFPADINGDGTVDIFDLSICGRAFGSLEGDPDYNVNADITRDGIVDISDISVVCMHYGESR